MAWKFRSINPAYRQECAAHKRALGRSMVNIQMVGDPPIGRYTSPSYRRAEVWEWETGIARGRAFDE
jgi:hypothetical protein